MSGARQTLLVALIGLACSGAPEEATRDPDRNPALDVFTQDLSQQPLYALYDARATIAERDDLRAIDQRTALDLAIRNRSPVQVSEDLPSDFPAEHREREQALRRSWQARYVAYSWDNLDPAAQLEPRPERLALTWLVLARYLPLARNKHPFEIPWVRDYFERKAWYTPRGDGAVYLSYIDKVQMERLEDELEAIESRELEDFLASLPLPGMSQAEAMLEARLAQRLLEGGTVFEDPQR